MLSALAVVSAIAFGLEGRTFATNILVKFENELDDTTEAEVGWEQTSDPKTEVDEPAQRRNIHPCDVSSQGCILFQVVK